MSIGLAHLDTFSAIGAFSGGASAADIKTLNNGIFADPDAFNKNVHVFYFSIGNRENTTNTRAFDKNLTAQGIKHTYFESDATAHEWQTCRRSFHGFAPLLFQN